MAASTRHAKDQRNLLVTAPLSKVDRLAAERARLGQAGVVEVAHDDDSRRSCAPAAQASPTGPAPAT
jgi:hypothetical protein